MELCETDAKTSEPIMLRIIPTAEQRPNHTVDNRLSLISMTVKEQGPSKLLRELHMYLFCQPCELWRIPQVVSKGKLDRLLTQGAF